MNARSQDQMFRTFKISLLATLGCVTLIVLGLLLLPGWWKTFVILPGIGLVVSGQALVFVAFDDSPSLIEYLGKAWQQNELRWVRAGFWWGRLIMGVATALLVVSSLGFVILGRDLWQLLALPLGVLAGFVFVTLHKSDRKIAESMHRNQSIE